MVTVGQLTGDATVARWSSGDRIWIWNHRSAKVYLFTPTTSAWTVFTDVPSSSVSETQTSDNLFIFDDEVWLGGSGGAVRYDDETWIKYTSEDGLIDGPITTIVKDRNGALWFAGQHQGKSGAARYDGNSWRIFTESDGLVGDNIANGLAADNGDVWFGTKHRVAGSGGGLMRFDGRSWTVYTTADGLLHDRIYDIGQTPDGVVWFGTFRGLGRFDPDQNQWAGYLPHPESGAPAQKVRTLSATRSVWIGQAAPDGGAAYFDGKSFDWFSIKDGLASDGVWEIFESRDGTVWTGTLQGLSRYDGLTWTSYSDVNSSPASIQFHSIAETTDGTLWMRGSGNTPVVRYVPDRNGPETRLQHAVDRVSSMGNIHLQWTGGDFWNKTPRDQLRYQYRIDDAPWSIASIETAFTFTLLSSGSYRFEVRAIDLDGNADPTPAIHAFIVEAPWWRNPVVAGPGLLIIAFALFQSARVVQGKRRLQDSVDALSSANNELFQVNVDLQREQVLERLRGQAQGMQSSEDIGPVVEAVYRELSGLGLPLLASGISISVSETEVERWTTDIEGRAQEPFNIEWTPQGAGRRGFFELVTKSRLEGDDYFYLHVEGEEAKEFVRVTIENGNPKWKDVPEERWPQQVDRYGVYFEGGMVTMGSSEPIAEEYLMLIKRFGEVFGYAHSRYKEL